MKEKYPFLRIIAAALPLMPYTGRFQETLFLGGVTCLALWALALFFKITWMLFPAGLRRTAVILALLAAVMAGYYLGGFPPMAGVSLYLLLPRDTEEKMLWPNFIRRWAGHGLGFWILMAVIGLCQELFGHMLGIGLFSQPAGILLMMALAAIVWQSRPSVPAKEAA